MIPGYVRTDAWDPVLAAPGAPEQVSYLRFTSGRVTQEHKIQKNTLFM